MSEDSVRLPAPEKLMVSSSPHIRTDRDVRRIMIFVVIALAPAAAAGVWFFGARALWVLAVCTAGCVAFDALFAKLFNRPVPVGDWSAVVTGLLLGMNLSAAAPWWVCLIGAALAIGLAKHLYGGLGYNLFNPALVGRVGLLIALPKPMTTWVRPMPGIFLADAVTTATPLGKLQTDGVVGTEYMDYLLGNMPGCVGETSALLLIAGGLLLIFLRIIRWQVPVAFIGTVFLFTGFLHVTAPDRFAATPLFHVLSGGLILGAFFMATDMVTSPMTAMGNVIFGVGCGIITCVIRVWGSYPEGVSFSILFMNALTPLIDRYTGQRPFGLKRRRKEP